MTHVTFTIPNMFCPACVMHLEGLEDELEGIRFVRANYRKQYMEVEFDEAQVSMDRIQAAVAELGYEISQSAVK